MKMRFKCNLHLAVMFVYALSLINSSGPIDPNKCQWIELLLLSIIEDYTMHMKSMLIYHWQNLTEEYQ